MKTMYLFTICDWNEMRKDQVAFVRPVEYNDI